MVTLPSDSMPYSLMNSDIANVTYVEGMGTVAVFNLLGINLQLMAENVPENIGIEWSQPPNPSPVIKEVGFERNFYGTLFNNSRKGTGTWTTTG